MKLFNVITTSFILIGALVMPTQAIAEDADWGQIAIFANEAWGRGDVVSACRLSIHAAHRINAEKPGSKYEVSYMRDYVAKYCGNL